MAVYDAHLAEARNESIIEIDVELRLYFVGTLTPKVKLE